MPFAPRPARPSFPPFAEPAGANGGKDRSAGLGANGIAMFVLTPGKELDVVVAGDRTELHEGQELIGLRG